MTSIPSALVLLAATCFVGGALVVRRRNRRKEGFLEISPRYRSFFRRLGVTTPADFLDLAGERPHIVGGHPDRNVARLTFELEGEHWNAFLKREHRVPWRTRLSNALAGFGFSSRSLREARMLQTLQREGHPGPEWLAAGEDERGRAFLLVREAPGMELRSVLAVEKDLRIRRRIARKLGATLARLHTAGFHHPDLYANHVFVDAAHGSIHLLDWQRARLRQTLSWRARRRDLAVLHATVDGSLATVEERLLCLRAYWRLGRPLGISWRTAVQQIESQARRSLARRHIREKRQPPVQQQAWICLDGEALCVTPVFGQQCSESIPEYLSPRLETSAGGRSQQRRWPALANAARALLVQRNQPRSLAEFWRPRRSGNSPEQRLAALLLRLQRHDIAAPQVLALGQRRGEDGRSQSFLLTQPFADTCSLEVWLANRTCRRRRSVRPARLWSVLRQAGALLRRLHEASCYLDFGTTGCGFAVRQAQGQGRVVLDNVERVTPRRRPQPRRAGRDLQRMQQILRSLGCSRSDLSRFRAGYRNRNPKSEIRNPKENPKRKHKNRLIPMRFFEFRDSYFDILSDFGFRISDFSRGGGDSFWRRLLLGVRRFCHRPDWPLFAGADWADDLMDVSVTDRYHAKQGRSTGRWILTGRAECQERPSRLAVFLKRHYELPRWRGWLATVWPWRNWSPAWREWRQLEWARRQGLPVPRMVAAAEYIGPWGKLRSCLAVEELAGMASLQEAIPLAAVRQEAAAFRQWKRGLAAEMARLTRMLHERRCFHKDLYLCHLFIAREDTRDIPAEGWRGRLHLIDLHRLAHHPFTWRLWQTKDLAEMLYSSEIIGVDARDRLAFWRAYRGEGPNRPRCSWMRCLILYRWRRYRRHNERPR